MALIAYFDDSREYPEGDAWCYHAIGGYVAPHGTWQNVFTPRWRHLLASAPLPLREFKSSDCRQGAGEFSDWTLRQRQEFGLSVAKELANPCYGQLFGVAAVIQFPQTEDLTLRQKAEAVALEVCLMDVIQSVCQYAHFYDSGSDIQFICDEQPGLEPRLRKLWARLQLEAERLYGLTLNDISFRSSHQDPPIQAADILVYEARKDLKGRNEVPPRRRSRALSALCESRPHLGLYYDAMILRDIKNRTAKEGPPVLFASGIPWLAGVSRRALDDPRPT